VVAVSLAFLKSILVSLLTVQSYLASYIAMSVY
jgi:hypothetical protein